MDLLEGFWSFDPNVRKFFTDDPLNLKDILPKTGDVRIVLLPLSEYDRGDILWRPPFSDINGWDVSTQEIICSHVVRCELELIKDQQLDDELIQWASLTKDSREYQATVIDIFSFLDFCKDCQNPSQMLMPYCTQTNGTSQLIWENCREIYKANLSDDCVWLYGCPQEMTLGIIIQTREDGMYAIYNQIYWCLDDVVATVSYKLEGYEKDFFTLAIKNATVVVEQGKYYL